MLRTALRPRWLALLALVLALATAFAALGSWQLDRARRPDPAAAPAAPVLLERVLQPQQQVEAEALAVPVVATGTYEPARAVVVVGRKLGGRPGAWVVVPLVVPPGVAAGSSAAGGSAGAPAARLAVVAGWTADPDAGVDSAAVAAATADLPAGPTDVVGRLQVSQAPSGPRDGLAEGQVRSLSSADLVNDWGPPVYAGYLLAQRAPVGLLAVPPPAADDGVQLLNLSYAVQWWLFAAFAVFLWWRLVRDEHEGRLGEGGGPGRTVTRDTGHLDDVPARGGRT